jgi:hypothetical protein
MNCEECCNKVTLVCYRKHPAILGQNASPGYYAPGKQRFDDITSPLSSHKLLGNMRIILILQIICNNDCWSQKIICWDIV